MSDSGWLLLSHEPEFLNLHYRRGAGKPTWEKRGKSESFHKYGEYLENRAGGPPFCRAFNVRTKLLFHQRSRITGTDT
jgi:hypothetical protein